MNIKRILSALESRLARHRKAAAGAAGALALLLILFFPLNLFSGTTVLVLVREDTTPETFARSLEKERVAAPSFLLEAAYSLARTGGVQPSSGYYALTGTDSLATFALKLRRSNLSQGIFRIPEGAPIWAVRALLEKNSLTTRDFTAEPDSTAAEALSEKYPELRDVIARAGGVSVLAHPRRFGLACHLGVLTDLPSIGVGKTAMGRYEPPGEERGDRLGVEPVFVRDFKQLRYRHNEIFGRYLHTFNRFLSVFNNFFDFHTL